MESGTPNVFVDFLKRYRHDSSLFVREVFGVVPDDWQLEIMREYDARNLGLVDAEGRPRGRRISVRSGHGVGKTALLSWLIVHHIICFYPQKTVATAPTSAQLFDALAAETFGWVNKLPEQLKALLKVTTERIELIAAPDESFVSFRTSRAEQPEALAGVHSAHVLLIGDEASGIPDPIFEAAAGSMSGHSATTVLAGNPVRSSGLFYQTHHSLRGDWFTRRVSCEDSPRVSKDFIRDMAQRYGERSNAYRVRVLGEFPLADDDTIIPFELMEAALARDVRPVIIRPIWGVDCARFGDDRSTLSKRAGNTLLEKVKTWHGLDTMELAGRIKAEWDTTPPASRPEDVCVDVIGLGAGVVDRLREMKLPVSGINVSESPALTDRFRNLRAELWWKVRDWLTAKDCNLAGDEELGAELIAVKYKFTSNGKIQVESKDEMKKRLRKSPDLADAFVLTFAREASTAAGLGPRRSWTQPLNWQIKGIV